MRHRQSRLSLPAVTPSIRHANLTQRPFFPSSDPAPRLPQGPPAKSKLLAASHEYEDHTETKEYEYHFNTWSADVRVVDESRQLGLRSYLAHK